MWTVRSHWSGGLPASSSRTFVLSLSPLTSDLAMDAAHFNSLSLDELWMLRQQVTASLTQKILVQKAHLEERLHRIGLAGKTARFDRKRRPYPPVRPKYRNPKNPAETWSGRGRLPRWLQPQLRAGRKLDDFLIGRASVQKRQRIERRLRHCGMRMPTTAVTPSCGWEYYFTASSRSGLQPCLERLARSFMSRQSSRRAGGVKRGRG